MFLQYDKRKVSRDSAESDAASFRIPFDEISVFRSYKTFKCLRNLA
jgi:hypothetical protein